MNRIGKYWARIAQRFEFEFRPERRFIRNALKRALCECLASEDSVEKKAVVFGDSLHLAHVLGLRGTPLLHLGYPEFTLENLALLSEEYDFVVPTVPCTVAIASRMQRAKSCGSCGPAAGSS